MRKIIAWLYRKQVAVLIGITILLTALVHIWAGRSEITQNFLLLMTVVCVIWYTNETRKLRQETATLGEGTTRLGMETTRLANLQITPFLMLEVMNKPEFYGTLRNIGSGPAIIEELCVLETDIEYPPNSDEDVKGFFRGVKHLLDLRIEDSSIPPGASTKVQAQTSERASVPLEKVYGATPGFISSVKICYRDLAGGSYEVEFDIDTVTGATRMRKFVGPQIEFISPTQN